MRPIRQADSLGIPNGLRQGVHGSIVPLVAKTFNKVLFSIFKVVVILCTPFVSSDEVGFIHPSQFVMLNREAGGSLTSSVRTTLQSEDGVLRPRVPEVNSSETVFWCRDHKLGISTQVLLPLYNASKHAFMASLERYKSHSSVSAKKDESGGNDMSSCFSPSLNILESELMKHSRALLLLSCDFVTAWNSRFYPFYVLHAYTSISFSSCMVLTSAYVWFHFLF